MSQDSNGFSDAGSTPHFHGHRDRLRQRFRDGGHEALQDYELLELLLFSPIKRADTKPIAKALVFGDLQNGGTVHVEVAGDDLDLRYEAKTA